MATFKVAIVAKGQEASWRDYWINSGTEGDVDAAPAALGRTQVVEATSLNEAITAVAREHPGCTVMLAGGSS